VDQLTGVQTTEQQSKQGPHSMLKFSQYSKHEKLEGEHQPRAMP